MIDTNERVVMIKDELLALRKEIVESARNVALDGDAPAEVRLPIILELLRGDNNVQLLRKAYELANQINDQSGKIEALLDILAEVDERLAGDEDSESQELAQSSQHDESFHE